MSDVLKLAQQAGEVLAVAITLWIGALATWVLIRDGYPLWLYSVPVGQISCAVLLIRARASNSP